MKYILEIILILITITCFASLMEYQRETSNLKAKLNQTNSILHKYINKDTTLNKDVLTQEFKEDYYLTQQQLNQDQIITFITLLFGILFFIGVGIFVHYVKQSLHTQEKTYTENHIKQQQLISKAHNELNNIGFITLLFAIIAIIGAGIFSYVLANFNQKIKEDYTSEHNKQQQLIHEAHKELNYIGFSFANNILLTADAVKNIEHFTYVYQTLTALSLFKYFGYKLRTEEEINSLILTNLQLLNSEVSQIITTEQAQRDLLWGCLSDLTSLKNPEITIQVNLLRAKTNDQ